MVDSSSGRELGSEFSSMKRETHSDSTDGQVSLTLIGIFAALGLWGVLAYYFDLTALVLTLAYMAVTTGITVGLTVGFLAFVCTVFFGALLAFVRVSLSIYDESLALLSDVQTEILERTERP